MAVDDARNAAVLALLAPLDYSDEAVVRARLSRTLRGASSAQIDATIAKIMSVHGPHFAEQKRRHESSSVPAAPCSGRFPPGQSFDVSLLRFFE